MVVNTLLSSIQSTQTEPHATKVKSHKMKRLSDLSSKHNFIVGVDGGVNLSTIDEVYETGIDVTIVGSGLYKADNINARFNQLMKI